jgi:N-acetylneuraminate synthase/N,N'-diacetyllegionaminate synthase
LLRPLELSAEGFRQLSHACRAIGIDFLATPFDMPSLEMLLALDVPAIKIASPDIKDIVLLRSAAESRRPLIVSTGAADLSEITEAVRLLRAGGAGELALLHCVSAYPTPFEEQNLNAVATLRNTFGCVTGYSDHSREVTSGQLAVMCGASILEKHFTLNRKHAGPDHAMSLTPGELAEYVALAKTKRARPLDDAEQRALGDGAKTVSQLEANVRAVARKSIAAAVDIPEGTVITREMLTTMRPGTGFPPEDIDRLLGTEATMGIAAGRLLTSEMVAEREATT